MSARLIVLCGMPASGKSTFVTHQYTPDEIFRVSSDDLIAMSRGYSQLKQKVVRRGEEEMAREALHRGLRVIVDRTNLSSGERKRWIKMAKDIGVPCDAIWIRADKDETHRRNAERVGDACVPEGVLRQMEQRWEEPTMEEGFEGVFAFESVSGGFVPVPKETYGEPVIP